MLRSLRTSRLYGAKGLARQRCLSLRFVGSSENHNAASVDSKPVVPTYPWRSVAVNNDGIWSSGIRRFVIWMFKKMLFDEKKIFTDDAEILKGATEAFRVVTSAIFPPVIPSVSTENIEGNGNASDQVVQLSEFCDFKLAEFFAAANNKIWAREAHYTLHDIHNARIVGTQLVIGGSRENIDQYRGVMDSGPIILVHKSGLNKYSPEWLAECIEDENLTLRYTIELTCTESLRIKSTAEDNKEEYAYDNMTLKHTMVIENHIQTDSEPLIVVPAKGHVDDWTVVDIGNWLNGNRFWDQLETGAPGDEELP